ncbi:MAG TPA: hypothetical protein VG798_03255, partial [Rhizomicrobium sp.]|nr:hypothetical protein [Rhizomicrobium sp.]
SKPFGIKGELGAVADLNEGNLGTQLIELPVEAFGAVSGHLSGRIKGLFYRHKAMAGYDYISEFLIAPEDGTTQTCPGDSGTVWYMVETPPAPQPADGAAPVTQTPDRVLRPIAIEWGGQGFVQAGSQTFNFSLATGLSTVCELLDVDLIHGHDVGPQPFWGQVGHYSIAAAAIELVQNPKLKALLKANLRNISFEPDALSADDIKDALSKGDFVELADVPDLVWKKVGKDVPGGRDYAKNAGPEHPNHYADADKPGTGKNGATMRDAVLDGTLALEPQAWIEAYEARGETGVPHMGLLPFRVWQIFDVMVKALKDDKIDWFVCAAGVISHYVGDACQPLHGSYLSNGYQDQLLPTTGKSKKWKGMGVHSAYEDKMVDANSGKLLTMILPAAQDLQAQIKTRIEIANGQAAARATLQLMADCAGVISPEELCDTYIKLGGGTSKKTIAGMWDAFGERTGTVMGQGACYLAAIWDAAYALAPTDLPAKALNPGTLAKIYQDEDFAPSLTIDKVGAVLQAVDA